MLSRVVRDSKVQTYGRSLLQNCNKYQFHHCVGLLVQCMQQVLLNSQFSSCWKKCLRYQRRLVLGLGDYLGRRSRHLVYKKKVLVPLIFISNLCGKQDFSSQNKRKEIYMIEFKRYGHRPVSPLGFGDLPLKKGPINE